MSQLREKVYLYLNYGEYHWCLQVQSHTEFNLMYDVVNINNYTGNTSYDKVCYL
jgi:hypothetical protein